jgi:hypothetical protein
MEINQLLKAVDNEENVHLINLNNKKIKLIKFKILKELNYSKIELLDMMKKLEKYRYIDGMNEIKYGTYIRWINITDPDDLTLKKGGIFCDLSVTDNGVFIIYKNFNHKHYKFKIDDCLIFQKITNEEQILLNALDHI